MAEESPLLSRSSSPLVEAPSSRAQKSTFSSSFSVLISSLGSVVGTGNIWRFPRICARHATDGGGLVFLLVWFCFLWLWSIPLVLIEFGVGRFTRKGPVEAFKELIGPAYRFLGAYIAFNNMAIVGVYSVVVGWCVYYFFKSCISPLPTTPEQSRALWDEFQESHLSILCMLAVLVVAALSISRGVSSFEKVNWVMVPTLLLSVVFSFYWAIFLPYASQGIVHLFTPDWASFGKPQLWRDAISQNAFDTSAGAGIFLVYATYMKRKHGVVKMGILAPLANNCISLICGIMTFSTVFSGKLLQGKPLSDIVETLQNSGPANTGITFIWVPVLYNTVESGAMGRVLCAIFFLGLVFAGISSLIAIMEVGVHVLNDFGIRRLSAVTLVTVVTLLNGTAAALSLDFFINQDAVWTWGQVVSGCFLLILVYRYGPLAFRRDVVNKYGIGDWKLPIIWVLVVICVCPLEFVALMVWWVYDSVTEGGAQWYSFTRDSITTAAAQLLFALCVLFGLNWWMKPLSIQPRNPSLRRWKVFKLFIRLDASRAEGYQADSNNASAFDITPTVSPTPRHKTTSPEPARTDIDAVLSVGQRDTPLSASAAVLADSNREAAVQSSGIVSPPNGQTLPVSQSEAEGQPVSLSEAEGQAVELFEHSPPEEGDRLISKEDSL